MKEIGVHRCVREKGERQRIKRETESGERRKAENTLTALQFSPFVTKTKLNTIFRESDLQN